MGASMKSIFLLLVISAFAISPAAAASKQKSKQATEAEEIAKQHDNTLRALRDGLPLDPADLVSSGVFQPEQG